MIGGLRALCDVPIMALTATASTETQTSIVASLSMVNPIVISQPLNRPNIFFSASAIKSLEVSIDVLEILLCQHWCKCRRILVV